MNSTLQHRLQGGRPTPSCFEIGFVVVVLLLSMGAFQNLFAREYEDPTTGMLGMEIFWSVLYLLTLFFYFKHGNQPSLRIRNVFPLVIVVIFAASSVAWSAAPLLTARRATALALTLVFGVYFASRFDVRMQFRLLAAGFGVCVILSYAFELLGGNPQVDVPGWYGIFDQKNSLGRMMVLGSLVFLFWKGVDRKCSRLANLLFLASLLLVLLARSATSLLVLAFLLLLLFYLRWSVAKSWAVALSGLGAFATLTVPFVMRASTLGDVTGGLGRDPFLTGRVPLWILSVAAALQRPWLGFGYEAFWQPDEFYAQRIWRLAHWTAPHAHNGFIELWLEIGLLGSTLFLSVLAYYMVKALRLHYEMKPETVALWPVTFLVFMLIGNLTEVSFLSANSVSFILLVSIGSTLSGSRSHTQLERHYL